MTLTSVLLLVLEPRGNFDSVGEMSLSSVNQAGPGAMGLIDVTPGLSHLKWDKIVIHQTGTLAGGLDLMANYDRQAGDGPRGYHFFIGNGRGANDGELVVTEHWSEQRAGRFGLDQGGLSFEEGTIAICIVGDARRRAASEQQIKRLIWLVHQLQFRYGIGAEQVVLRDQSGHGVVVGGLFPEAWFRQQLLSSPRP